jgi:multidrug resistance efflux pump
MQLPHEGRAGRPSCAKLAPTMTTVTDEKPKNTTGSRRVYQWHFRRLALNWPLYSWIGLAALCLFLYVRTIQYGIVTASAQVIPQDVAPLETARVKAIYVQIGSHVTKGQELAQLDTTLIDVQIAEAEATLATAEGAMAGYQGEMLGQVRTVEDQIIQVQREIELETNALVRATAKLNQLHTIQAERDKQFAQNLIPEQLADALRPEIADVEKEVAAYPSQIAKDEQSLTDQRKHRNDLQKTLRLAPEEDITKAITDKTADETKVLQSIADLRKLERDTYTLRAERDGVVSDIKLFPGVVAKAGDTVLTVVSGSDLIIGYLPEIRLGRVRPNDQGFAFRAGHPAIKVRVQSIVPEIDPVPAQLSPISAPLGATMRSQKIVFQTEEPTDITAGERVEIRIDNGWWTKFKRVLGF